MTKSANGSTSTKKRSAARVNSRTNKVHSDKLNTAAVADVVSDVLPSGSVDVVTIGLLPSLGVGSSVSVPAASGLSDGASLPDGGVLSSPAVGGRRSSGRGRNNSADQTNMAFENAAKEVSAAENAKEESLYNKVVSHFTAPEFNENAFAAEMISKGMPFSEIKSAVSDGKKEWYELHPAPSCDVAKVLSLCVSDYAKEFADVVGVAPDGLKPADVRVYSRPAGVLVSRPVARDASAASIARAVLSYRFKVIDDREIAAALRGREIDYHNKLDFGLFAGVELGYSDDRILEDCRRRLSYLRERESSEVSTLRSNFMKIRSRLDSAVADVLAVCPDVALYRLCDGRDNIGGVPVLPENISKEQRSVCGAQFAKIRNYRRQLSAINAKLWGVDFIG